MQFQKSPFLLMAELDRYFETGVTNRIVNEKRSRSIESFKGGSICY